MRQEFYLIKGHTSLPKVEGKLSLKPVNLFKRLIPPPSPKDGLRLPPRVVYSSFTASASRSQSSSHRLHNSTHNNTKLLSESKPSLDLAEDQQPICLFKKPMTLLNCNSSSDSCTSSRGGGNMRYSRCGDDDEYGQERELVISEEAKEHH